ncbi:MAG: PEP-CTERM sorting domain-containing protein [Stigonema ocellatum SAG 48.90 = DSM 106950]|nr:PEP-CTERM sorting domain-containing protein [Stigonema ocellatum SAG 48.90 = DSM 106950]
MSRGTVRVSGTIVVSSTQKVPEPTNTAALIGMGMIGVGFRVRRQRLMVAFS